MEGDKGVLICHPGHQATTEGPQGQKGRTSLTLTEGAGAGACFGEAALPTITLFIGWFGSLAGGGGDKA